MRRSTINIDNVNQHLHFVIKIIDVLMFSSCPFINIRTVIKGFGKSGKSLRFMLFARRFFKNIDKLRQLLVNIYKAALQIYTRKQTFVIKITDACIIIPFINVKTLRKHHDKYENSLESYFLEISFLKISISQSRYVSSP